jgi:HK97 family phage major capsid protein
VPTEYNATLGTVGDIVLADLSQYLTVTKGDVRAEMSMHLRFDYDELAFRFIFRIDGDLWWNLPLTPFKGSATQSPVITLDTRS